MRINFLPIRIKPRPAERKTVRPSCVGRRERGTLVVDCRGCRQKQDLADQRCFKGIIKIMSAEAPGIREVMLSRDWEIVYDQECADVLAGMGDIVRFANGINFQQPFEDCASCLSNPRTVIARVVESLPQASPDLDTRHSRPSGGHGRACEQCVRSLRSNLDHARNMLEQVEMQINKAAYRVVNFDEH
jgi:bacterioferritin-associated ferredoxin